MESIKGYVMCALMASAVAGILKCVSSGMRNYEKYIGFVCSLTVVIMLATPFISMISDVYDALSDRYDSFYEKESVDSDDRNDYEKTATGYYAKAVENSVTSIITSKFSLDNDDIRVIADITSDKSGNYRIEKIIIVLYRDIDTSQVEYYLKNILCIETEIRRSS